MYFSIHAVRHFCSPELRLPAGEGMHFSKQFVLTLEMSCLALLTLLCSVMADWMRWRVCVVEGEEDGKEEESGFVMVGDESVDEELLFLSSEEEEEPPKNPPNAMVVSVRCRA
jgi:hypothetical protein